MSNPDNSNHQRAKKPRHEPTQLSEVHPTQGAAFAIDLSDEHVVSVNAAALPVPSDPREVPNATLDSDSGIPSALGNLQERLKTGATTPTDEPILKQFTAAACDEALVVIDAILPSVLPAGTATGVTRDLTKFIKEHPTEVEACLRQHRPRIVEILKGAGIHNLSSAYNRAQKDNDELLKIVFYALAKCTQETNDPAVAAEVEGRFGDQIISESTVALLLSKLACRVSKVCSLLSGTKCEYSEKLGKELVNVAGSEFVSEVKHLIDQLTVPAAQSQASAPLGVLGTSAAPPLKTLNLGNTQQWTESAPFQLFILLGAIFAIAFPCRGHAGPAGAHGIGLFDAKTLRSVAERLREKVQNGPLPKGFPAKIKAGNYCAKVEDYLNCQQAMSHLCADPQFRGLLFDANMLTKERMCAVSQEHPNSWLAVLLGQMTEEELEVIRKRNRELYNNHSW